MFFTPSPVTNCHTFSNPPLERDVLYGRPLLYLYISIALLTAWAFSLKRSRPQQLTLCRSLYAEALSREWRVFHVDGMWTSTMGEAPGDHAGSCGRMWREGGVIARFSCDVISGWSLTSLMQAFHLNHKRPEGQGIICPWIFSTFFLNLLIINQSIYWFNVQTFTREDESDAHLIVFNNDLIWN